MFSYVILLLNINIGVLYLSIMEVSFHWGLWWFMEILNWMGDQQRAIWWVSSCFPAPWAQNCTAVGGFSEHFVNVRPFRRKKKIQTSQNNRMRLVAHLPPVVCFELWWLKSRWSPTSSGSEKSVALPKQFLCFASKVRETWSRTEAPLRNINSRQLKPFKNSKWLSFLDCFKATSTATCGCYSGPPLDAGAMRVGLAQRFDRPVQPR